ncbi:MAG: hypothetical protein RBT71_09505 [Flavobacteriales bacterium]|jgi:hypothetical protein|nr:hypothetical protein [Flavobacteriales bacterium]
MAKRKTPPASVAAEPQAAYGVNSPVLHVALGVEDAVGGFLRPLIQRKHRTRGKSPTWATVAEMIGTYTDRNDLILGFISSLDDEELRTLFNMANRHLKDWEGIEQDLGDPAVRRSVEAHRESVRRIKVKARSLLERDMRGAIAQATADRARTGR